MLDLNWIVLNYVITSSVVVFKSHGCYCIQQIVGFMLHLFKYFMKEPLFPKLCNVLFIQLVLFYLLNQTHTVQ